MSLNKEIIELVNKVIINLDPKPLNVNNDFPLRWETNIYLNDYDFSENYLELDQNFEKSSEKFLKSVATAIEINKDDEGNFEYWDGVYMIETHVWCSKLNTNQDFPSFSLINQKFRNLNELKDFLVETYS
jgi:hypothetical protein